MKRYIYAVLTAILIFLLLSGIIYTAISFSAMSTSPIKWTAQQRDVFATIGIGFTGLVSIFIGTAVYSLKDKR